MKHFSAISIIAAALLLSACCNCAKDTPIPYDNESGIDVERFDSVFAYVHSRPTEEIHSMVVLKGGKIIYERYDDGQEPDYLHILWSASKTFTATAIGFAVQDGLLSVDDKVIKFFDSELPSPIPSELQEMTVHNLLTMSSGFNEDCTGFTHSKAAGSPSAKALACGYLFHPGEQFSYNSMDTYLLSAIITKLTGLTCEDYLDEKLFKPLGIRHHVWEKSVEGYSTGGWGLHITTQSFAKAGQFFLQRGQWEGKQLLDSSWFDKAMSVQIKCEWDWIQACQGYGYQMWACSVPGVFRFDGAWGQYCIIMPDKDAVVAVNCHCCNTDVVSEILKDVYPYL